MLTSVSLCINNIAINVDYIAIRHIINNNSTNLVQWNNTNNTRDLNTKKKHTYIWTIDTCKGAMLSKPKNPEKGKYLILNLRLT